MPPTLNDPWVYDPRRDPRVDHAHELYPQPDTREDMSDVLVRAPGQPPRQVVGTNVDDDDVAHFLRITADPGEPDLCGGCGQLWPCEYRVPLQVLEMPAADPQEERLREIALDAVRNALATGQG